jgi:hypothetical protein
MRTSRGLVKPVARFLALATLALVGLAALDANGTASVRLGLYVAAVGAIAVFEALHWLRGAIATEEQPVQGLLHRRPVPGHRFDRPVALTSWEGLLESSIVSGRPAKVRLAPRLRQLARMRLAHRRGVDLDDDPVAARALLGDVAWSLIELPDRVAVADGPPVPPAALTTTVDRLEQL